MASTHIFTGVHTPTHIHTTTHVHKKTTPRKKPSSDATLKDAKLGLTSHPESTNWKPQPYVAGVMPTYLNHPVVGQRPLDVVIAFCLQLHVVHAPWL